MSTHAAQRPPKEVMQEALGYLEVMIPILNDENRSPEFTLNMDQTPMWHAMTQKGLIDTIGRRTINVRTGSGDTKPVTPNLSLLLCPSQHRIISSHRLLCLRVSEHAVR